MDTEAESFVEGIRPRLVGSLTLYITWSESTQRPIADCETWSLASADLDAEELAGFAREVFGAGLLALFYDTLPLPTDE